MAALQLLNINNKTERYNNEINKLLLESIDKSQTIEVKNKEIERLKDEIHNLDLALKRR